MNFNLEILVNFDFFFFGGGGGYQICQQTVHKIAKFHSHFQLKSTWEGRNNEFKRALSSEILEELSKNKKID